MKSSSALFPVALMRAEVLSSKLIEDTYLIKPNNSPDLTAQIAVSRLGYAEQATSSRGQPVVLLHGLYSNRSIWLNEELHGLASYLLEQGMDPWMLEFRGHGDSPMNQLYDKNSIEVYSRFDMPAVQAFIEEQTHQKAVWLGYESGGVAIATALAEGCLELQKLKGVVLFDTQVSSYPLSFYIPFLRLIKRFKQNLRSLNTQPASGPETEPKGVLLERLRWAGLFTRWRSRSGKSYWKAVAKRNLPVLAFIAKKDTENPVNACSKLAKTIDKDAQIIVLSKKNGFQKDYKNLDAITGEHAPNEVWPALAQWIKAL